MNDSADIPLTLGSTPDSKHCSLISVIPTLGMSSCRGRAEAFARRLSSKLRTLGSQTDEDAISQEEVPIINGSSTTNTWVPAQDSVQTVTHLQPLPHESDSFLDFDCDLESPGSPVDECEYLRLIETASNTPHNSATESGYVCASAASSHSSSDGPYFDITNSESSGTVQPARNTISASELPEYVSSLQIAATEVRISNGIGNEHAADECFEERLDVGGILESELPAQQQKLNNCLQQTQDTKITISLAIEQATEHEPDLSNLQDKIINELRNKCADISNTPSNIDDNGHSSTQNIEDKTITDLDFNVLTQNDEQNQSLNEESIQLLAAASNTAILPFAQSSEYVENAITKETNETNNKSNHCIQDKTLTKNKRSKSSSHLGVLDTTDDEDDCRPQRIRRCSSLKTGKTPPGTPGRKKIVRFADVLGLDLADIKTFLDEIPTIPKSAFEDLEILDTDQPIQMGPKSDKLLMPLFQQPGGMTTFLDMVREKQVSLENAAVTDHINQTITGSVRVRNLDFHKSVHIRYTLDSWRSYADLQANYVENTCDGFSDRFTFVLFGNSMQIGQRLEFAVRFQCKGQQFWDNNYGTNYCFQCLPTTTPTINLIQPIMPSSNSRNVRIPLSPFSPATGEAWCSSLY